MFQSVNDESSKQKPKLSNTVHIRWRDDGVVVFYGARGEARLGLKGNANTAAMRVAIELARADAVPLEVEL